MRSIRITSRTNPLIKHIVSLRKRSEREQEKVMLVEGVRELGMAVDAGYHIKTLVFCPDSIKNASHAMQLLITLQEKAEQSVETSLEVFEKIAFPENPCGLLAIVSYYEKTLQDLPHPSRGLYLILESLEKPVNLGSIFRLADGAGVDAVLVCDPTTDCYNQHVIRASTGAIFSIPFIHCSSEDAVQWCRQYQISIVATTPEATTSYTEISYRESCAIVMGSEKDGLSNFWLEKADKKVFIPMQGHINSLNVAVSAGVVVYEAIRQRKQDRLEH